MGRQWSTNERDQGAPADSPSDLVGLLVSCLLVVVAFSPVVFVGRTLSTAAETVGTNGRRRFPASRSRASRSDIRPDKGASAWQFEPWAEITHRAYANGELPLWNPYQATGAPLAANMQSAVFDPLLLAVNLHPTPLDVGHLHHRRVRARRCCGVRVRTRPGPRRGARGRDERRILSQRLVLPLQQQRLQPLVRLPAPALPPRRARAALAAASTRPRARRRGRRQPLRGDARGVVRRAREHGRVRRRPVSSRSVAGRACACPSPVSAVRACSA